MPSFGDSIFIFFLALLLFGPKKLPELARQLGKLMAELRRASNEFKFQMEDEFRQIEQAEQQKKLAQDTSAAPAAATPETEVSDTLACYENQEEDQPQDETQPIATSGELSMMPPATGLPVENTVESTEEGTGFPCEVSEVHTSDAPDYRDSYESESYETEKADMTGESVHPGESSSSEVPTHG